MPSTLTNRVHGFFQKFKRDRGPVVVPAKNSDDTAAGEPQADAPAPEAASGVPATTDSQGREVSIHQLKQGYGEVIETMQSVRRHLDEQAKRSDRLFELLEGLPQALQSLPEQNRTQTEMLQTIASSMERQTQTTGELSTAISGLTTIGENQQKTMTNLQEHLRAEDVARRELRDGIGALDTTLGEVRQSSDASRATLESISSQARDRDAAIAEMFRRSQKTTSAMMAVSWALAVVALAVSAFVAVSVVQLSGSEPAATNGTAATASLAPAASTTAGESTAPASPADPSGEASAEPATATVNTEPDATDPADIYDETAIEAPAAAAEDAAAVTPETRQPDAPLASESEVEVEVDAAPAPAAPVPAQETASPADSAAADAAPASSADEDAANAEPASSADAATAAESSTDADEAPPESDAEAAAPGNANGQGTDDAPSAMGG